MATRLEPINVLDFTGGLNLRLGQFQLGDSESPEMLNVDIDPRGGFFSRRGWRIHMDQPIAAATWNPRTAYFHTLSTGVQIMYVANDATIWHATDTGPFTDAAIVCGAVPHLADFAPWGDVMYVATGTSNQGAKRTGTGVMAVVPKLAAASMNDDYTAPTGGRLPAAEYYETHSGYMFAANTSEDAAIHPNRIRWSHPNQPEDWAALDFIDLTADGSSITGIVSFQDHLLIFKEHSMWALYGYDADSWQLVQKSASIGAYSTQAITKSQSAIYFFNARNSPGVYAYDGGDPIELTEPLRIPFTEINVNANVWLGWSMQRLWVSVPWHYNGPTADAASVFIWDSRVGDGAWIMYDSVAGAPGPYFQGQRSQAFPVAAIRVTKGIMDLEATDTGFDEVGFHDFLVTPEGDFVVTPAGDFLTLLGSNITVPESYYRTRWIDAGWPTRKKSWRRPDMICREYGANYKIRVQVFRDHVESIRRAHVLDVSASGGGALWGEPIEWGDLVDADGDPLLWGAGETSSVIERGSSLGLAKAVQLRFLGPATRPSRWGIDAIVLKYVQRRFR